ncbi:MAG: DegQ family serine endoprotease [Gammaproteobacteria bacterium]|nr:DegQ family serine endoprotease [Gammaproteobacteria bacterium]
MLTRHRTIISYSGLIFLLFISPFFSAVADDAVGISSLRQTSKAFSSVAKNVSPSVVFIKVESTQKVQTGSPFDDPRFESPFNDDIFKRFFGERFPGFSPPQQEPSERKVSAQGSGFVYSLDKGIIADKSYIITNNHVVEDADKIHVTFLDGREYDAKITGTDPKSDIAVIEISDTRHSALAMGDSSQLEVGEWVIALGNPFGLSHTLTVGVVSAKGRTGLGINDYEDFIQTDAAINPGNSGGPLVNLNGEVVGINTAIFSRSGGYMGVGFAIPANLAIGIANQLIQKGEVTRGYLGIVIQKMTSELAESFGIKDDEGILVAQVSEGSPASKAGIKVGDLIVSFQGSPVSEVGDFRNRVAVTKPGTKARVDILRDGKKISLTVGVGELSDESRSVKSSSETTKELGFTVSAITSELAEKFDIKMGAGVVVTDVKNGSIAELAGVRVGAVVLEVNQVKVNTIESFKSALSRGKVKKKVLLLISDRGMSRYLVLNW